MSVDAQNRLQPSLLDRLTDDQRGDRGGPSRSIALAMRADDAQARGIVALSDLADRSRTNGLKLGMSGEFLAQPGGWAALRKFYGLAVPVPFAIERGAALTELLARRVDVVEVWSAESRANAVGIRILPDDRRFFVGYEIEADPGRVMSKSLFRQAVLRDLGALFNATQPLSDGELAAHPALAASVLNFGMPALTGQLASKLDIALIVAAIRDAIVRFEPRVMVDTLEVVAIEAESALDTHNVIEFEIRGHLWSQPLPIEILLRTQLDLEAGQVAVLDTNGFSKKS